MVNGFFACFPGLGILYSCIKRYKKGCDMIVLRSFGKTWANFKLGSTLQGRTWWGPCSKWLDGSYKFDSCEKVVPGFLVSFWKDNPESVSSFVKVRRWLVFVFITWSFKVELDHLVWYCRIISGNSPKYIGLGIIWNWHVPSCLILSCESFVRLARISCFFLAFWPFPNVATHTWQVFLPGLRAIGQFVVWRHQEEPVQRVPCCKLILSSFRAKKRRVGLILVKL